MLQGKGVLIIKYISAYGAVAVFYEIVIAVSVGNPFSKIKLPHLAVAQYLHQIADIVIVQVKFFCILIKNNSHDIPPGPLCRLVSMPLF